MPDYVKKFLEENGGSIVIKGKLFIWAVDNTCEYSSWVSAGLPGLEHCASWHRVESGNSPMKVN